MVATKHPQRAFTLIELMITVAIVGILAAVAYPSYQEHIRKSREAEARAALISVTAVLAQYRLDNGTFNGASLGTGGIFSDKVPVDNGSPASYNLSLTIDNAAGTEFTVTATPVDPHSHTYTIDEAGNKTPAGW